MLARNTVKKPFMQRPKEKTMPHNIYRSTNGNRSSRKSEVPSWPNTLYHSEHSSCLQKSLNFIFKNPCTCVLLKNKKLSNGSISFVKQVITVWLHFSWLQYLKRGKTVRSIAH